MYDKESLIKKIAAPGRSDKELRLSLCIFGRWNSLFLLSDLNITYRGHVAIYEEKVALLALFLLAKFFTDSLLYKGLDLAVFETSKSQKSK